MRSQLVLLVVFIGFLVFSCKKKQDETPAVSATSTSPSVNGLAPSTATVFSGIFSSESYTYATGSFSTGLVLAFSGAYFTGTPQNFWPSAQGMPVSSVFFNGDSLAYQTPANNYGITYTTNPSSQTWSINGASGIPSFTFADPIPIPNASGFENVPPIISKAAGFTVNINNVGNIDNGYFVVDDGNSQLSYTITPGNNLVTVSSASLMALDTAGTAYVYVGFESSKVYTYSGKNFKFKKQRQLTQSVKIKP